MIEPYNKFKIIFIIQILCFTGNIGWSQNLNLKVAGNNEQGFNVDIYNDSQILVKTQKSFLFALPTWI